MLKNIMITISQFKINIPTPVMGSNVLALSFIILIVLTDIDDTLPSIFSIDIDRLIRYVNQRDPILSTSNRIRYINTLELEVYRSTTHICYTISKKV